MKRLVAVAFIVMAMVLLVVSCIDETPTPTISPLPTPTYPPSPLAIPGGDQGDGLPFDIEAVLQWIVENQEVIALATAFLVSLVSRGMKGLEATGSQLMLSVEKIAREQVVFDGVDKMSATVNGVLDKMPPEVKPVLVFYAALKGKSLDQLVHDLCQKWYDKAVNA